MKQADKNVTTQTEESAMTVRAVIDTIIKVTGAYELVTPSGVDLDSPEFPVMVGLRKVSPTSDEPIVGLSFVVEDSAAARYRVMLDAESPDGIKSEKLPKRTGAPNFYVVYEGKQFLPGIAVDRVPSLLLQR